jgi:alkylated DNA nucleotide flippase Atl1
VKAQPLFRIGRQHQRKMIFERLERAFDHPELIDFDESELQIEHIMPQTLSAEWREHLRELGQDPDAVHEELADTLGNLTLTGFNGTLSNNPFERKKEIYGESHLELNRALVETSAWARDEILSRADALTALASAIWIAPLAGVPGDVKDGFDWSRVEAAIAAIPVGRWTTYGDIAEVGGTSAQAVGNFVMNMPAGTNAFRVLSADGSISGSFKWADPDDSRDVEDVLIAEGVVFEDGRAGESQRISSEKIPGLIDDPDSDPALDEPALEGQAGG